jgi:hypothetical protein
MKMRLVLMKMWHFHFISQALRLLYRTYRRIKAALLFVDFLKEFKLAKKRSKHYISECPFILKLTKTEKFQRTLRVHQTSMASLACRVRCLPEM